MYFTVYKTTNIINNKTYIGSHKTKNLNDKYLGSGKLLNRAIKKYGIKNFVKEILFIFDNSEDMYKKEKELVNEDWLKSSNTYNMKIGGWGGWDYIYNNPELFLDARKKGTEKGYKLGLFEYNKKIKNKNSEEHKRLCILNKKRSKLANKKLYEERLKNPEKYEITRKKISKYQLENNSMKNRCWCVPENCVNINDEKRVFKIDKIPTGWIRIKDFRDNKKDKNNPCYGKFWVYNLELKENKLIEGEIPHGWVKGRKMEFYPPK